MKVSCYILIKVFIQYFNKTKKQQQHLFFLKISFNKKGDLNKKQK